MRENESNRKRNSKRNEKKKVFELILYILLIITLGNGSVMEKLSYFITCLVMGNSGVAWCNGPQLGMQNCKSRVRFQFELRVNTSVFLVQ